MMDNKQELRLKIIPCISFTRKKDADQFAENIIETLDEEEVDYLLNEYKRICGEQRIAEILKEEKDDGNV